MTQASPPPPGAYTWQMSDETRDEERVADRRVPRDSAWAGWLAFATVMMVMVGVFQGINGLTAIFQSGTYVVGANELVVDVNYTAWGWVHLVLGLITIAAGFGLLAGQMWARVVGIAMAVLSAVVNLAFIPATPFGSTLVITLDVVVIYAIAVHGGELKDRGYY